MQDFYFRTYVNDNDYHIYQNKNDALCCYDLNDGCKIEIVTKELIPETKVLFKGKNVDVDFLSRKDNLMAKTSISQQKAIEKYDKKTKKGVYLKLNKTTDEDIINYLESCENVQGKIKELIRNEMKKSVDFN